MQDFSDSFCTQLHPTWPGVSQQVRQGGGAAGQIPVLRQDEVVHGGCTACKGCTTGN
jgi:hypothetical protein